MLKEIETEETIVFFVAFLSLVAFQLGGGGPPGPPGYANVLGSPSLAHMMLSLILMLGPNFNFLSSSVC